MKIELEDLLAVFKEAGERFPGCERDRSVEHSQQHLSSTHRYVVAVLRDGASSLRESNATIASNRACPPALWGWTSCG